MHHSKQISAIRRELSFIMLFYVCALVFLMLFYVLYGLMHLSWFSSSQYDSFTQLKAVPPRVDHIHVLYTCTFVQTKRFRYDYRLPPAHAEEEGDIAS